MKLYKEFSRELATLLTAMINASLKQSKSPTAWKTAYVTPLPKSTNSKSVDILRPVAITPIPSLIYARYVFVRACVDIADSVDLHQFGNVVILYPLLLHLPELGETQDRGGTRLRRILQGFRLSKP